MRTSMPLFAALVSFRATVTAIGNVKPSCVINMESCLSELGVPDFHYKQTVLPANRLYSWGICGKRAISEGACAGPVGDDSRSEPAQMYLYHVDFDLVEENTQCKQIKCSNTDNFDYACETIGCGGCSHWGYCADM